METPTACSEFVQRRRNPHRKGRPTPSATLQRQREPNQETEASSESLKVYLRIRPQIISRGQKANKRTVQQRNSYTKNDILKSKIDGAAKFGSCISVSDGLSSVTIKPPASLQDSKRLKSEVFEGFSRVFPDNASQDDVYEIMVKPLVEEFFQGKNGMLAALGPSGSGKTYTMFGTSKKPGILPLALHQIFQIMPNGTFCLSLFEIYSEQGKAERINDLSKHGIECSMYQSVIKGLHKVAVSDASQAQALISCALLKRATAKTNTNSQSSRSQFVINIHNPGDNPNRGEVVLTFIDLAGAEREKKTRNQGSRLLESNFINNTTMVFGQCLRSLLEHQKNPKKPLQKHFQNSLLTKFLRDHMEGKKRMTLILTAKPDSESYLDTVYLLRQASPFTNIKFEVQDATKLVHKKRLQTCSDISSSRRKKIKRDCPKSEKEECSDLSNNRNFVIMQSIAKAMWKVLKEVNVKLKIAEKEIQFLNEKLEIREKGLAELETEPRHLKHTKQKNCEKEIEQENSFILNEETDSKKISELENSFVMDSNCNQQSNCETIIGPKSSLEMDSDSEQKNIDKKIEAKPAEMIIEPKHSLKMGSDSGEINFSEKKIKPESVHSNSKEPKIREKMENASKNGEKIAAKQKRRLLPASGNLLRDVNALLENDPPNIKCDRKSAGNITLMRLLQSNKIN